MVVKTFSFKVQNDRNQRQPALTIQTSPCLEQWRSSCESHSTQLERVDNARMKEIRGLKPFWDLFDGWKTSPLATKQQACSLLQSVPENLQTFEEHVNSVFLHDNIDTSHLRGMVFVALEAAEDHAGDEPQPPDSGDVLIRLGEMVASVGQKLQLLTALGVVGSIAQQTELLNVYDKLLGFLQHAIVCLRSGPIDSLEHPRWLLVERQYLSALSGFDHSYSLLKELNTLQRKTDKSEKSSPGRRPSSTTEDAKASLPSHCVMLPARNSRFFPRREVLEQVQVELGGQPQGQVRSVVLHGLGGVGKTEIAREFAYEAEEGLNTILWIRSHTAAALAETFTYAALRLDLMGAMPQENAKNRALVLNWLSRTSQKWLLIFDNAENPDDLQQYWPGIGNGSIIITTRHPQAFDHMARSELHIQPFSEEEGAECLLSLTAHDKSTDPNKRTVLETSTASERIIDSDEETDCDDEVNSYTKADPDKRAAIRLCRSLGGLPLGISQMAAFTRSRGLDLTKCQELYGRQNRRMHKDVKTTRYNEYKQDLTTVWAMQFNALREVLDAKALLGVLTFVSPDSVPESLFQLPEELNEAEIPANLLFCKDDLSIMDAEETLLDLSLILKTPHTKDLSLHRLVQVEYRYFLSHSERQEAFDAASYLLARRFPKQQRRRLHEQWDLCKQWVQHVLSLNSHYLEPDRELPKLKASIYFAYVLSDCAWFLYEVADYKTLDIVIAGGREACKMLGDQREARRVYGNLCNVAAVCFESRGFFDEAEALQRECLEVRLKTPGTHDIEVASCYRRLRLLDESLDRFDQYFANGQKAAEIVNSIPSSSQPPYWMTEWNCSLSRVLIKQGKYDDAEAHLKDLLHLFEGTPKWYITSLICFAYGNLHLARHEYAESYAMFEKTKKLVKEVGNSKLHPDKVACIYKMGRVGLAQGDRRKAIAWFCKALRKLDHTTMTESHRARVSFMLSEVLRQPGPEQNLQEAAELRAKAVEIFKFMRPRVDVPTELSEGMFDRLVSGQYQ
ncbi:hypothetical protein MMC30_002072 [Trapelia coarctata]|nr:hypothetical protein [Trapelia coarctata]